MITQEAKKTETKVEEKKPTPKQDPNKLYEEGYKLFLDGKYQQAIDKFEQVLKIDPKHEKAKEFLERAKKRI